jgi:hypothetical protein
MTEIAEEAPEAQDLAFDKEARPLTGRRTLKRPEDAPSTPQEQLAAAVAQMSAAEQTAAPAVVLKPLRHPRRVLASALALGVAAKLFFDGKPLGLTFPLFVAMALGALGLLSGREGWHGARRVRWLALPIVGFAALAAVRGEELTVLNMIACALLAGLLVQGYSGELSIVDLRFWEVPGRALQGWLQALITSPSVISQSVDTRRAASAVRASWWPALKAVLVTVPVLAVFMALLSSGDEAFARVLSHVLSHVTPGNGALGSAAVVLGSAQAVGGCFAYALRRRTWTEPAAPSTTRWLGALEASCVVFSLVALFGLFSAVKLQELFVEHTKLIPSTPGVGWGTYTREGFEQLTVAASLVLALLVALPRIARLDGVQRSFRLGATALVALTLVILATAVNRLVACEEAYGFTVTRIYGHVFGFALAAVLVWRGVTVWVWRQRFAVGALAGTLGWLLALDAINPAAFVVAKNYARYEQTGRIDRSYNELLLRK